MPPTEERKEIGEELNLEDDEENANKQGEELLKEEINSVENENGNETPVEVVACTEEIELVKLTES